MPRRSFPHPRLKQANVGVALSVPRQARRDEVARSYQTLMVSGCMREQTQIGGAKAGTTGSVPKTRYVEIYERKFKRRTWDSNAKMGTHILDAGGSGWALH